MTFDDGHIADSTYLVFAVCGSGEVHQSAFRTD
jgi:hypothetical protein